MQRIPNHLDAGSGVMVRLSRIMAIAAAMLWGGAAGAQPLTPQVGEIELGIEQVGVASVVRPGSWIGVKLSILNRTDETKEIVLQIVVRDADGDRPSYQRVVAANRGIKQSWWVYMRVPASASAQSMFDVLAFEAEESADADGGYRAGRLLARELLVLRSNQVVGSSRVSPGVMGTIGRPGGVQRYDQIANGAGGRPAHAPFSHERTRVVQMKPEDLPDRWMGLEPFDVLVWTQGPPQSVRTEQAEALTEWIERGGHLVIVLPARGQEWLTPLNNELHGLLPAVVVERAEDVDLEPYRLLLAGPPNEKRLGVSPPKLPSKAVLHTFTPRADAEPGTAIRVLNGPEIDGRAGPCIAVRRLLGTGAVTLIGIDVGNPYMSAAKLPRADVFWNRVLGKRMWTPDAAEVRNTTKNGQEQYRPESQFFDDLISGEIAAQGQAAKGVLLGFVVFAAYWAIAGPISFAVLKRTGKTHHAWLIFLGSIGLFTAVAWGGATVLRPRTVSSNHLTVLIHVYGQPVQRARSWMSLLIPEYGDAMVRIETPAGTRASDAAHNAIAPWESRQAGDGVSFPDAREYAVDSMSPDHVRVPARQTVKQLRVDWAGMTAWGGMPRPTLDAEGRDRGIELITTESGVRNRVRGLLVHDLPAPLQDVLIIVNEQQTKIGNRPAWELATNASAYQLKEPWAAGVELDLEQVTGGRDSRGDSKLLGALLDRLTPIKDVGRIGGETRQLTRNVRDQLTALMLYPVLTPVDPLSESPDQRVPIFRSQMHGLDVGKWLSAPCVIVIGHVFEDSGSGGPIPMSVDGRAVDARGRTLVVWVYALPGNPPSFGAAAETSERSELPRGG